MEGASLMQPGKLYEGRLDIHGLGNQKSAVVDIEVEDATSHTHAITISTRLEDMAQAIFLNRSLVPCSFSLTPELVGTREEMKRERIGITDAQYAALRLKHTVRALLDPYEVDGWVGSESDLANQHNITRIHHTGYPDWEASVGFIRYVRADGSCVDLKHPTENSADVEKGYMIAVDRVREWSRLTDDPCMSRALSMLVKALESDSPSPRRSRPVTELVQES